MKMQGVGFNEARKALTVSKAVLRIMKVHGRTAVQAIDELTSRLNIATLLASKGSQLETAELGKELAKELGNDTEVVGKDIMSSQRHRARATKRAVPGPSVLPIKAQLSRKVQKMKHPKTKLDAKASAAKNPRKRSSSASESEARKRVRADSVTEEFNAKIAKSAPASPDPIGKRLDGPASSAPLTRSRTTELGNT